jgi:DNA-binding transcriptional regulator YiaG
MPKIEMAIKEAIDRGARRHIRQVATPLRREVRRLRQLVAGFRKDLAALKATAAQWERTTNQTSWTATVSDEAAKAARLSARLIRKLRTRLGLSQAALGRVVGVTGTAVVEWERGRAEPSGERRKAIVALRGLGRRDVKRLLDRMPKPVAKRGPQARKARRRTRRRRTQASARPRQRTRRIRRPA